MSNIKYGLISETDSKVLERTIKLISKGFPGEVINICEVGVYGGETGNGIRQYAENVGKPFITGIDNSKDGEPLRFQYDRFISGNSTEVYNQIPDDSQHFLFIDGDHSYIGVISDFYAYKDKVKVGGYLCFHDSGTHIKPFTDFQHGDKENADAYISVRKALGVLGLLSVEITVYGDGRPDDIFKGNKKLGWELIFDEADSNDNAGGICVFKKLY